MNLLLILLLAILYSANAFSNEELLLELRYKRITLSHELTVIKKNKELFISIDDFFYESGFITRKEKELLFISDKHLNNIVEINLIDKTVKSELKNSEFTKEDFIIYDDRYYFSNSFIKEKLYIDLKFLEVEMKAFYSEKSTFKTPVVQKIDRKTSREIVNPTSEKKNGYQKFNPSIFTIPSSSHNFSFLKNDTGVSSTSSHSLSNEFMGFEQFFSFNIDKNGGFNEGVIKMSRYDENGIFPGLDITEIELFNGNFNSRESKSVSSNNSDIFISNGKRGMQGGKWDTRDFRGVLKDGWEVELYVNKRLIGATTGQNGEYLFKDVSLNRGNNEIELVFLGPFGEISKEKDFIRIGGSSQYKDKIFYNFSFNELEEDKQEYSLILNTPLGDSASLDYSINNSFINEEEDLINSLSFNFSVPNSDYRLYFSDSKNKGNSSSFGARYSIFDDKNLDFTIQNKNDFLGDDFTSYDARISGVDFSTNWTLSASKTIDTLSEINSVNFAANKDIKKTNIGYRVSKINNQAFRHNVDVRRRIYDLSFSSSLSYSEELEEYSIAATKRINDYSGSISYKNLLMADRNETSISLADTRSSIAKNITYKKLSGPEGDVDEYALNFSFGFGNILNPTSVSNTRSQGGIKLIAFSDFNNNGVYDHNEAKIEGVYFNVGKKLYSTGPDGSVEVSGLSRDTSYYVSISDTNIDYMSSVEGYEVTPHEITMKEVYFPVNRSFEIEGNLECEDSNCVGIILVIESTSGGYRDVTYTTSGGFFYKDLLPMGSYKISVSGSNKYEVLTITNHDKTLLDELKIKLKKSTSH